MRTITENVENLHVPSSLGRIPFVLTKSQNDKKNDSFYELGAEKTVTFGAYDHTEEPGFIKSMRENRL